MYILDINKMKILCLILGFLSLLLGVIGIFLPLLPTTPFLLLAAALLLRASPKYYHWLLKQPMIGAHIRSFREEKILPLHAKISTIILLWLTIGCTVWFTVEALWLKLLLFAIALGVTVHVLSFKSK